jgi:hypothetical protein
MNPASSPAAKSSTLDQCPEDALFYDLVSFQELFNIWRKRCSEVSTAIEELEELARKVRQRRHVIARNKPVLENYFVAMQSTTFTPVDGLKENDPRIMSVKKLLIEEIFKVRNQVQEVFQSNSELKPLDVCDFLEGANWLRFVPKALSVDSTWVTEPRLT